MARYGKEHKQATRQRIIDTAGRRFKADGIDGSGVATLMADAGLTNGAFYAHFSSKEDLVANVVADQIGLQARSMSELPPGRAGLEAFLRRYLSPQHRDDPGAGCPAAALLDEIGRCPAEAKDAYTEGARVILGEIARRLSPRSPESAQGKALALYTMTVGTLQAVARAVRPRVCRRGPRVRPRERPRAPSLSCRFVAPRPPSGSRVPLITGLLLLGGDWWPCDY